MAVCHMYLPALKNANFSLYFVIDDEEKNIYIISP